MPSLASGDVVRNIEIDAKDPNIIWLTINNSQPKVLKSTDGGKTWTDYSTGLSKYKIVSIVHQKGSNGGVYVGTQYGVYYRDNSLSSWVSYGFNLPGEGINFLKINYYSQKIRAATIRGIWENDLYQPSKPVAVISSDVTSIPCNSKTPVRFSAAASALSGNGTKYEWSFQGGVPATSSSEIVDVFYPKAGNYDVTLTVKDNYGSDVSTLVKQITVTGSCAASTEIVASSIDGTASICVSTPISATITNGGMNVINSYTLKSYLNGVLDKTINRNVSLTTGASDVVTLGNYTLKNISEVKVVVENPNGTADNTSNNTVTINPVGVVMSTPFISVTSQSSNDPFNTADLIFDKNINTYWQSNSSSGASLPYTLVFNLNGIYDINGFELLNRQYNNGAYPKDIEISASSDNVNWGTAQKLTFASSSSWQSKSFIASNIKFLRVKILSTISGSTSCSIAEIRLKGCSNSPNEIETHSTPNELFIFPNPAQDKIKIQTEEIMQQVLLIDAKGAEHLLKSENGYYDINSFSQGIYILKLTGRDKVYHSKLVISR